ncbi:MAG: GAF domain-containing protein, partial [Gemmatimonadota bacterium]|nr:GAF domain-containing protein [Gemmatimonadota bacterium]
IMNCDTEPVQTPGCVQAHGALLVLRQSDLTILQASENVLEIIGRNVQSLLQSSVSVVLGTDGEDRLREFLAREQVDFTPLFLLSLPEGENHTVLDVTVHTIDGVVVLEFEPAESVGMEPADYFGIVKKTIVRLQSAHTLIAFCGIVANDFRLLTGLDRVMIYRFHPDHHGEVFAESKRDDLAPWLGLHYPADDIPKPAREIFMKAWVRPVPDVSTALAELVPLVNPDNGHALEMTYCALRGPSVMYTEYLRNMGVKACLTMPIRRDGKLWGLIACHHYDSTKALSYKLRAACEFLAQVVSLQQRMIDDREHLHYRLGMESVHQQLIARASSMRELSSFSTGSPSLLDAVRATGAAMFYHNQWFTVGTTPEPEQLAALAEWLRTSMNREGGTTVYASDNLASAYPAAAGFTDVGSGLLAMSISRNGRDLLLWFREEVLQSISWAGNPHDKPSQAGPHGSRLTPRHSFELFRESVKARAEPWIATEVDAVGRFRAMIMELIVSHAEELAGLNAELVRSNRELDAFAYLAGHDLKEPLRGIRRYVDELQHEASLGPLQRQKLESMVGLASRMDRLLDSLLEFARVGRSPLSFNDADLNEVVSDAIEMVSSRTITAEFIVPRTMPTVRCDYSSVSEIYVNLFSNALKYNDQEKKLIEIGYIAPDETFDRSAFPAGVSGVVFYVKDNGIGIAAEHFERIFRMFKRLHGRSEYGGGSGAGLTIVKKMVQRHNGAVWVQSAPGAGTTFYFGLAPMIGDRTVQ